MKFSVFPARIGVRGQVVEKLFIKHAAGEAAIQNSRVDANRMCSKPEFNEGAR